MNLRWHEQTGSLHLAYSDTELAVLEDYVSLYGRDRDCAVLTAEQVVQKSPAANPSGLKGALWSAEEVIVDPREAISGVAGYLEEQCGVVFRWNPKKSVRKDRIVERELVRTLMEADQSYRCRLGVIGIHKITHSFTILMLH